MRLSGRREREAQEARLKARTQSREGADAEPIRDDGLQAGERALDAELAAEQSRKAARDVLLDEAARIMGDVVDILRTDTELARRTAGVAVMR